MTLLEYISRLYFNSEVETLRIDDGRIVRKINNKLEYYSRLDLNHIATRYIRYLLEE